MGFSRVGESGDNSPGAVCSLLIAAVSGRALIVVTHGPITPWLVGSVPDQGSNPRLLHW